MDNKIKQVTDKTIVSVPEDLKNVRGDLGPICNNCAGYGFTIKLGGGNLECPKCFGTGVYVDLVALRNEVKETKQWIAEMIQHLADEGIINMPKMKGNK